VESVISQRIQDAFVFLAITSSKFLKSARQSVKPDYFSSMITEDIITWCYAYFDQFGTAPDNHFHDELERHLKNKSDEDQEFYLTYLVRIQDMDKPDIHYILSRISEFIKAREFESAAIKFAKLTAKGEFDKAELLMSLALRSGIPVIEDGLKYSSATPPSYHYTDEDAPYICGLGIPHLDHMLPRGLCRGDLVTILGGFKGRKSWFLFHLGREVLLHGFNVLHISHELSRDDCEKRYDMCFGGLTSEHQAKSVQFEVFNDEGKIIDTNARMVPSVYDATNVYKARKKAEKFGGTLWLKKYPALTGTMDEIERYVEYLEVQHGFRPDVIINDYIEKMKLPFGDNRRNAIHEAYMVSKRIAEERNLLMVTVSQVNRQNLKKKVLGQESTSENIEKIGDVDLALGISQTMSQSRSTTDRMQMYIIANRHGKMDMGCTFNSQLDAGQLVLYSWPLKFTSHDDDHGDDD